MNFEPASGRDAFVISGIAIEGASPDGSELVLSEVCLLSCKYCNPFSPCSLFPPATYIQNLRQDIRECSLKWAHSEDAQAGRVSVPLYYDKTRARILCSVLVLGPTLTSTAAQLRAVALIATV